MSQWQDDVQSALQAFITVAGCAGDPVSIADLEVEFLPAPHKPPSDLSAGKMAVYGFCWQGVWLKVGKAGPNSKQRYTYQHYNAGSAMSTLAGSLLRDPRMAQVLDFDCADPGKWIKASSCRVNILMPATKHKALLSLLEAFLHVRLDPRYEG